VDVVDRQMSLPAQKALHRGICGILQSDEHILVAIEVISDFLKVDSILGNGEVLIHDVQYDRLVSHVRDALNRHKAVIACMLGCIDMHEVCLIYIVSHLIT